MDCPKCNLRYNTVNRKPQVHRCGHTICEACSSQLKMCIICKEPIDPSKTTFNHSLIDMLKQRKIANQIDKLIKVCFVGQSKVGKTSLINRLKGFEYRENTVTTIGYDFAFENRFIDDLNVRFQLWDSAGQERYRSVSPLHYKNSDIVVIVYDMTQSAEFNNVQHWLEEANRHSPQHSIKLLIGNKIDLMEQANYRSNNPIDKNTWKIIAAEKISNYSVSCKSNEGVEEFWKVIEKSVKDLLKKVVIKDNPFTNSSNTKTPSMVPSPSLRKSEGSKLKTSQAKSKGRAWCPC